MRDAEPEDPKNNFVYRALYRNSSLVARVEETDSVVCLPPTAILKTIVPTSDTLESHILFPSRMFLGRYTTANGRDAIIERGVVTVSSSKEEPDRPEGSKTLHAQQSTTTPNALPVPQQPSRGQSTTTTTTTAAQPAAPDKTNSISARVIAEEIHYHKNNKATRMLSIDGLLCVAQLNSEPSDTSKPLAIPSTFNQCKEFFEGEQVNTIVLQKIQRLIHDFNTSYLIPIQKEFAPETIQKVKELLEMATTNLSCVNPDLKRRHNHGTPEQVTELILAIESFVMGQIHPTVWPKVNAWYLSENISLHARTSNLTLCSQIEKKIGFRTDLAPIVPVGKAVLEDIVTLSSPFEMLNALQDFQDCYTCYLNSGQFSAKFASRFPVPTNSTPREAMSADALLPLIIVLVLRANLPTLYSSLIFMENFTCADLSVNNMGYNLANLRAAMEYIMSEGNDDPQISEAISKRLAETSRTIAASLSSTPPPYIPSITSNSTSPTTSLLHTSASSHPISTNTTTHAAPNTTIPDLISSAVSPTNTARETSPDPVIITPKAIRPSKAPARAPDVIRVQEVTHSPWDRVSFSTQSRTSINE
ncbi:ankyrin repeat domain-containing protein 27 [Pelomyxa schiedti]|nr:ankyrin repeat domain-containing protein 27 [Pelomyxa schiedti]